MRITAAVLILYCAAAFSAASDIALKDKPATHAGGHILKCTKDGKTTYTNTTCETGETKKNIEIQPPVGVVSPSRKLIDKTLQRIRAQHQRENEVPAANAKSIGVPFNAAQAENTATSAGTDYPYPYPVVVSPNPCLGGQVPHASPGRNAACAPGWRGPGYSGPRSGMPVKQRPHTPSGKARLNVN